VLNRFSKIRSEHSATWPRAEPLRSGMPDPTVPERPARGARRQPVEMVMRAYVTEASRRRSGRITIRARRARALRTPFALTDCGKNEACPGRPHAEHPASRRAITFHTSPAPRGDPAMGHITPGRLRTRRRRADLFASGSAATSAALSSSTPSTSSARTLRGADRRSATPTCRVIT
jgi:hypothetical protein